MNPNKVNSQIRQLTDNEDEQQELWVHYLSGNQVETFASKLQKIKKEESDDHNIKETLWTLHTISQSSKYSELINSLTDFERNIVFLLMLDFTPQQIAEQKGISEVRIRQAIMSLRYNSSWEKCNVKERSDRSGTLRVEPGRDKTGNKVPQKA